MSMHLRSYQEMAVAAVFNYFAEGGAGNPLVAMPTGTGKSLVLAALISRALKEYPSTRILKLTHVKELIAQNHATLLRWWPTAPAGIYSAGLKRYEANHPIVFAGIASVYSKADQIGRVDLVLVDEAHLLGDNEASMYQKLITDLKGINPHLRVIGFTATPFRQGLGLLTDGGLFTDVCFDMTGIAPFNWLIEQGYLAPLIPRATDFEMDVSGVGIRAGEYNSKELQAAVDKEEVTARALDEALRLGADRKCWMVFASGVEHALHVADALNDRGITATCVHSKLKDAERDQRLLDFKAGKYQAIVNNSILTTGFDHPPVDMMVILRPTRSTSLHVQILGRGTRPSPATGKENCLVLDFAGNTRRLGPINNPVLPRKKGSGGTQEAPCRVCSECQAYNLISAKVCAFCGAPFPIAVAITPRASEAPLIAKPMPDQRATCTVDRVVYSLHRKAGKPDSIRVTYYSGLNQYSEWVCPNHGGYARLKFEQWWKKHGGSDPIPPSTEEALAAITALPKPRAIEVVLRQPPAHNEVANAHY